jgi:hypothetical protein
MTIAAGQIVRIEGNPVLWEVISAGPTRVRVRPVDPSYIRTVLNVPTATVKPYRPTTTMTEDIEAARRRSHAKAAWGNGL